MSSSLPPSVSHEDIQFFKNTKKKEKKSDFSSFSLDQKPHPFYKMSQLLATFVHYLEHTKNSSQRTVKNYTLWIQRAVDYLGDPLITQVQPIDVLNFRIFLDELGLSKKTVNFHIIALRAFFKFLSKNEIDCLSPEKIELSKIPQREVSYLQEDEIEDILNAPLRFESDPLKQARDLLILQILYGTGLRVSELIALKRENINF